MLRCPNCYHEQEVGKFCGKCGSPVEEIVAENENIEEDASYDAVDEVPQTEVLVTEPLEEQAEPQEVEQPIVQEQPVAQPIVEEPAPQQQQQQQQEQFQQQQQQFQQQQQYQQNQQHHSTIKVDDVKENAAKYWGTFLAVLKNPSKSFALHENQLTFGIVNIVLYIVSFMLSIYFTVNTIYKTYMKGFGFFDDMGSASLPVIDIGYRVIFMVTIFTLIAILSIWVIEKIFIKQMLFKEIVIQYAGLITPLIVVNVVAIITGLSMSLFITAVLLSVSLMFAMLIAPIILIYEKLKEYGVGLQRVYISYGSLLFIMFVTYIIVRIVLLSSFTDLVELIEELEYMF